MAGGEEMAKGKGVGETGDHYDLGGGHLSPGTSQAGAMGAGPGGDLISRDFRG